ncbi:hypothetical protein ACT3SZ_01195 [Corynebacterium sp. AOP40-9SA-29]|uniref:hypothetical protein n=1 Tax=Corynebacterium sp. AOP40-9SA-29 TaxID=3457677 RepID=UPI0040344EEE
MSADLDTKGKFSASPDYLDGYVPSSWDAPHSSLQRATTWLSMALLMLGVSLMGVGIFGFAAASVDAQENGVMIGIVGWIIGFVLLIASFIGIHIGRTGTRNYRKETGRVF